MTFDQRPALGISGDRTPGRRNSGKCKGPEVGVGLVCSERPEARQREPAGSGGGQILLGHGGDLAFYC